MAEGITDKEIQQLIERPKEIDMDKLRGELQKGFVECECRTDAEGPEQFFVLGRVNKDDSRNFSWILRVVFPDDSNLLLIRCNGLHGIHRNSLDKRGKVLKGMHIHKATARYIRAGKKPEGYAYDATGIYSDENSALAYLMTLCKIRDKSLSLFNVAKEEVDHDDN